MPSEDAVAIKLEVKPCPVVNDLPCNYLKCSACRVADEWMYATSEHDRAEQRREIFNSKRITT